MDHIISALIAFCFINESSIVVCFAKDDLFWLLFSFFFFSEGASVFHKEHLNLFPHTNELILWLKTLFHSFAEPK